MTATTEAHKGFPHRVVQRTSACSVDMDGMVAPLNEERRADGGQLQTAQTRMSIMAPQKVVNDVAATLKRKDAPNFPAAHPKAMCCSSTYDGLQQGIHAESLLETPACGEAIEAPVAKKRGRKRKEEKNAEA